MEKGELRVEELASSTASFEDLVKSAGKIKEPCLDFQFKSPTCIQYKNTKVYEMFPHREAVFHSLLSKWNAVCPEELKMSMERDDMARFMIEKPLAYETHSIVVNTVFDKVKGHARPIMRQGFTGRCQYTFTRNAPEGLRNGIVALAKFAEYSGVGSAVAAGAGRWLEVGGKVMEKTFMARKMEKVGLTKSRGSRAAAGTAWGHARGREDGRGLERPRVRGRTRGRRAKVTAGRW